MTIGSGDEAAIVIMMHLFTQLGASAFVERLRVFMESSTAWHFWSQARVARKPIIFQTRLRPRDGDAASRKCGRLQALTTAKLVAGRKP